MHVHNGSYRLLSYQHGSDSQAKDLSIVSDNPEQLDKVPLFCSLFIDEKTKT